MEDKILVNLSTDANHTFECPTNIIGREGEGNTTRFEITIPAGLTGCSVYLDFEKPNGEKIRTPKLAVENGVAVYDVVEYLLTVDGEIKVQAVLITENGQTWKSSIKKYTIHNSINALEEIPEKDAFMVGGQKLLDELRQESANLAERNEAEKARADAEIARDEAERERERTFAQLVARTRCDCSSGVHYADYSQAYLKITVPNQSTILDLIVKYDDDAGGENVGQYDFMTWRLHLKGNFCSGQCSTVIQDASTGTFTLHYTTDDDCIYIYLGYNGYSIEAYMNGILEAISATFEKVETLPSDAKPFTMN